MLLFKPKSGDKPKTSLKQRFWAWWEGIELPENDRPQTSVSDTEDVATPLPTIKLEPWETPILKVKQTIWGEGYHRPGGPGFVLELVKPFALNKTMSMLEFGCGMGGSTREIGREFDVWMTGVERDPLMVEAGRKLSTKAGMERRAEIQPYETEQFVSRPGGFDCILCAETLHAFDQREGLMTKMENCLKTRGQIVITDYVRGDQTPMDDAVSRAGFAEDLPALWTHMDYERRFKDLNFDLRVNEDITEKYRAMILSGVSAMTRSPEAKAVAKAFPEETITEVESWAKRVAAMDAGKLKVYRFYGIKMSSGRLMSDWS